MLKFSERGVARAVAALLFVAVGWLPSAVLAAGPEDGIWQLHAYEGPRRPPAQVATFFLPHDVQHGSKGFVELDKRNLAFGYGVVPTVMYVLPGEHQVTVRWSWANTAGYKTLQVRAEAGRAYEFDARVTEDYRHAAFRMRPMPPGHKLTYKDVHPGYYRKNPSAPNVAVVSSR